MRGSYFGPLPGLPSAGGAGEINMDPLAELSCDAAQLPYSFLFLEFLPLLVAGAPDIRRHLTQRPVGIAPGRLQFFDECQRHVEFADGAEVPCGAPQLLRELPRVVAVELQQRHQLSQTPGRHPGPVDRPDVPLIDAGERLGEAVQSIPEDVLEVVTRGQYGHDMDGRNHDYS